MKNLDNKILQINVGIIDNISTIYLRGHFAFAAHREFKTAYQIQLSNPAIHKIVIDLAAIQYLDSSALGMLLVLRDHAIAASKALILSRPSSIAARTFDVAGFHSVFTIT